jgi:hypothetical protein
MKKFLGYILSPRKRRLWLAEKRLHKMKQVGEIVYADALYQFLLEYRELPTLAEQRQVNIDMRAHDIGEVVQALATFRNCVIADSPSQKYYTQMPDWYADTPTPTTLIEFMVDRGYLLNIEEIIETIAIQLQEIRHAMPATVNAELVTYYQKKSRRLYQEVIRFGEALL